MGAETKHTPGPWEIVQSDDDFDPISIRMGTALATPGRCRTIHRIDIDWDLERGRPDYAEGRANLHLIAAAPDLYAALIEAVEAIEWRLPAEGECKCSGAFRCVAHSALDIARSALARAQGETP